MIKGDQAQGATSNNTPQTAIAKGGWAALTLICLVQLLSLLDRQILAILGPRIKSDLHIGDAEMGMLYGTVFGLFYALFSLPLGRLSDGWVRTRLLAISIMFWSLATALAGFATGFGLLALSRLGVGIGEASSQPAGTSLLLDYFPRRRRGLALAAVAAAIALGLGFSNLLGGVAAGWWDRHHADTALKGWQFAFLVAAAPGLPLAILLWRMAEPQRGRLDGIPTPKDPHPFRASGAVFVSVLPGLHFLALHRERAGIRAWTINLGALIVIVAGATAAARWAQAFSPRPPLHLAGAMVDTHVLQWSVTGFGLFVLVNLAQMLARSDKPVMAVMASPTLQAAMLVGALQSMINYGAMGFTPAFLMKNYHLTPAETGLQFGLLAAAIGVIGPMVAGPTADWVEARAPGSGRAWLTMVALCVSPLLAIFVFQANDAPTFYMRFVAYAFVLTLWLPPLYALMYEQVLPRMRGITASIFIILSTLLGIGLGPYCVGLVSDASNGDLGHAILSINWVAVPIAILLLIIVVRGRADTARVVDRARRAGEVI